MALKYLVQTEVERRDLAWHGQELKLINIKEGNLLRVFESILQVFHGYSKKRLYKLCALLIAC